MPIIYDIETDYLYKRGLKKGREEQRKQLEETVIRCLEKDLDYSIIAEITELSESEIKAIDENRKGK